MRLDIVNGPNLNLTGKRQPEIYGNTSFETFLPELRAEFPEQEIRYFQTNHEGEIIDHLQGLINRTEGVIINPAAYTHTSIAIADTVALLDVPVIEVHLSDISNREEYRRRSYIAPYCVKSINGRGINGYRDAVEFLVGIIIKG